MISAQELCDKLNNGIANGCDFGELAGMRLQAQCSEEYAVSSMFVFGTDMRIGFLGVINGLLGGERIAHVMPDNYFMVLK